MMQLGSLATLYVLVGAGAVAALVTRVPAFRTRPVDLVLLGLWWPLYGPFLLLEHGRPRAPRGAGDELSLALEEIGDSPLAPLLPSPEIGRQLGQRLQEARRRCTEIEALLSKPEFCENTARERHQQLEARGEARAAGIALARVQSIRRLRGLRDRFARELEEIHELLAQLRIQAEVVRFAGTRGGEVDQLIGELLTRVDGLEELVDMATAP